MPPTRDCLQRIHSACAAGVYRYLCTLTLDPHAAEDLLQEVFVKLARNGTGLEAAASPEAWVFRTAHHAAIDWRRRHAVRERAAVRLAEPADCFLLPDDPDAAAMQRELTAALALLPVEQRDTVHLHLWEDLTFREIGEIHGIPAATAASRYRYGITALRTALKSFYSELHEP